MSYQYSYKMIGEMIGEMIGGGVWPGCVENNENCTICLMELRDGRDLVVLKPCNHVHHQDCFESMIKKGLDKCPQDRQAIEGQEIYQCVDQDRLEEGAPISELFKLVKKAKVKVNRDQQARRARELAAELIREDEAVARQLAERFRITIEEIVEALLLTGRPSSEASERERALGQLVERAENVQIQRIRLRNFCELIQRGEVVARPNVNAILNWREDSERAQMNILIMLMNPERTTLCNLDLIFSWILKMTELRSDDVTPCYNFQLAQTFLAELVCLVIQIVERQELSIDEGIDILDGIHRPTLFRNWIKCKRLFSCRHHREQRYRLVDLRAAEMVSLFEQLISESNDDSFALEMRGHADDEERSREHEFCRRVLRKEVTIDRYLEALLVGEDRHGLVERSESDIVEDGALLLLMNPKEWSNCRNLEIILEFKRREDQRMAKRLDESCIYNGHLSDLFFTELVCMIEHLKNIYDLSISTANYIFNRVYRANLFRRWLLCKKLFYCQNHEEEECFQLVEPFDISYLLE